MWEQLDPKTANLQSLYEPLLNKASQAVHPWSIAEMKLSSNDIQWLKTWFADINPEIVNTIIYDRFNLDNSDSHRKMFGGILLCAAAEICREECREDYVWPAICRIIPATTRLKDALFLSNGQPSQLTKEIITDAVNALNLRHAMDIEGTQQWFVTIKLQFGFTYKGAKSRLAEWLVGLGEPEAVKYLNGDSLFPELASDSFQALWKNLKQFRKGWVDEDKIRESLLSCPWIKPKWIDDLLIEARARIETLGTGEWLGKEAGGREEEVSIEDFCPIADIFLDWPTGSQPHLRFKLAREAIQCHLSGTNTTELDFLVDGNKITRWLLQQDGSWAGDDQISVEPAKLKSKPNLCPKLLTIRSGSGEDLLSWDIDDSGLSNEILVFDLKDKRMLDTDCERLEPNRHYAIVCDRHCEIQECTPIEQYLGLNRKVLRLPTPLDHNLRIMYDDFVLWQPVRLENHQRKHFTLTITTPQSQILTLNEQTSILIEGLPEDADQVELLIHRTKHAVNRNGVIWQTVKTITMTPELASGQRRVRVRFLHANQSYTLEPHICFRLLVAAMIRHKREANIEVISLAPLLEGHEINCSEGANFLRIWTPEQEGLVTIFEGDYKVGPLRHSKIKLCDIPGYGEELYVSVNNKRMNLGVVCQNTGRVRSFLPAILGAPAQLSFLTDTDPKRISENEYLIYEWILGTKHSQLKALPYNAILSDSNDRVWKIHCSPSMLALALTWKGVWLGAWSNIERIREYICSRTDLPEYDFAIMKWNHTPILHCDLEDSFRNTVIQRPIRFVRAWLMDKSLADTIQPDTRILASDFIVRHFLWNDFPVACCEEAVTALGLCNHRFDKERCLNHLKKLFNISLPLYWKGIAECRRICKVTINSFLDTFFIPMLVGLNENAKTQMISNRIYSLEANVINITGINSERLKELISSRIQSMNHHYVKLTKEDRTELNRLGEMQSGRKYLAIKLAQHWLNTA